MKEEVLDEKSSIIKLESEFNLSDDEYLAGQEANTQNEICVKQDTSPNRDHMLDSAEIKVEYTENEVTKIVPFTGPYQESNCLNGVFTKEYSPNRDYMLDPLYIKMEPSENEDTNEDPFKDNLRSEGRQTRAESTNSAYLQECPVPPLQDVLKLEWENGQTETSFISEEKHQIPTAEIFPQIIIKEELEMGKDIDPLTIPKGSFHYLAEHSFTRTTLHSEDRSWTSVFENDRKSKNSPNFKHFSETFYNMSALKSPSAKKQRTKRKTKRNQKTVTFGGSTLIDVAGHFCCQLCYRRFPSENKLQAHIARLHSKIHPTCDKCQEKFESSYLLKMHKKRLHKSFLCNTCLARITSEKCFRDHRAECRSKEKPFSCDRCSLKFHLKAHFEAHAEIHREENQILAEEKPFMCDRCQVRFKTKSGVTSHIKGHPENWSFCCDQCSEKFRTEEGLSRHLKTHWETFPCPLCQTKFSDPFKVQRHVGEFHFVNCRFVCLKCSKSRKTIATFKRHLKNHAEETPYFCKGCSFSFDTWSRFYDHLLAYADKSISYSCEHCQTKFPCKQGIINHMKEQHSEVHGCPQ